MLKKLKELLGIIDIELHQIWSDEYYLGKIHSKLKIISVSKKEIHYVYLEIDGVPVISYQICSGTKKWLRNNFKYVSG